LTELWYNEIIDKERPKRIEGIWEMAVQIKKMEPHGQSPWLSAKAGEDSNAGQNGYFLLEVPGCVLGGLN